MFLGKFVIEHDGIMRPRSGISSLSLQTKSIRNVRPSTMTNYFGLLIDPTFISAIANPPMLTARLSAHFTSRAVKG